MGGFLRRAAIYFGLRDDPDAPPEDEEPMTLKQRLITDVLVYVFGAAIYAVIQLVVGDDPARGLYFGLVFVFTTEYTQWRLRRRARQKAAGS